MVIRINVITRIEPGRGLARDLDVIREALVGHAEVRGVEMAQNRAMPADVNIFCETPVPKMFQFAPVQMLVPNPELWDRGWDARLQRIERVLCKTHEAAVMFGTMYGWMKQRTTFVGWRSEELYDPSVTKERRFLHVGGPSDAFKGTDVLLEAWQEYDIPYPLTVVGSSRQCQARAVTMLPRMPRAAFVRELNRHAFHIVPSLCEGWCHASHEAAGVAAVLIATDAPPMSDHAAIGLPATLEHLDGRSDRHRVSPIAIRDAVRWAMDMEDAQIDSYGQRARAALGLANEDFVVRLRAAILG